MEQHKQMKQDLYTIRALESKGYTLDEVIKLSDEEIDKLQLSNKLLLNIKDYKSRGAKPVEVIKEQIAEDISVDEVSRNVAPEVIEAYVENTEEQLKVSEEVQEIAEELAPVVEEEDVVVIERVEASKEDLDIIKEALQTKELKSVANYVKHLKSLVPESILSSVDSSVVSQLINERIAEVKENAK
jgi:vacuolar-type H+-ATPase subunit I/STV1